MIFIIKGISNFINLTKKKYEKSKDNSIELDYDRKTQEVCVIPFPKI